MGVNIFPRHDDCLEAFKSALVLFQMSSSPCDTTQVIICIFSGGPVSSSSFFSASVHHVVLSEFWSLSCYFEFMLGIRLFGMLLLVGRSQNPTLADKLFAEQRSASC